MSFRATPASDYTDKRDSDYTHYPKPLNSDKSRRSAIKLQAAKTKRQDHNDEASDGAHNKYHRLSMASPSGIFKSILASLILKKSPRSSSESASIAASTREDHWKMWWRSSPQADSGQPPRDDAIQEASKLKYSMAELEKKLTSSKYSIALIN